MDREQLRSYLLGMSLWLVDAYLIGRAVVPAARGHLIVAIVFACFVVVLTAVRVRMRGQVVSAVALVTFLSVTALGPALAAAVQLAGVAAVLVDHRSQRRWRQCLQWLVADAPMFMAATLLAGWAYRLTGGRIDAVAPHPGTWVLPFLTMAATALTANLALLAAWQGYVRGQDPLRQFLDLVRYWSLSGPIYLVIGLALQALYYEIGTFSLPFILALLLLLRLVLRIQADNQGIRSELASTLAQILSLRDPYTGGHSQRVAAIAVVTGRALGLSDAQLERIRDSALVHDIGKVAVPDAVLRKPGPLDATERTSMDVHVTAGGELLEHSPHLRDLARYVLTHHAHAGPEEAGPPVEARIIAAADAFDAMTTDRPYRAALPVGEAVRRLRAGAGAQFDSLVVDALVRGLGLADLVAPATDEAVPAAATVAPLLGAPSACSPTPDHAPHATLC